MLFLHGIGGNRTAWRQQLPAFAEHFTAAAWDARGYLDSDDYDGVLAFSDFADDVCRVLDAFGAERAHLVGMSMGGRIALHAHERCPDRIASLVLADTSAGSAVQASAEKVDEFLRLRKAPLLDGKTVVDIAPDVARTLVGPQCDPRTFAEVVRCLSELRRDSYLKTLDTVTRFTAFPPFATIRAPTCVVVGEHDRIATPDYARRVAQELPEGELHVLNGVGHTSNMEDPDNFNAIVLGFLLRHRSRANSVRGLSS